MKMNEEVTKMGGETYINAKRYSKHLGKVRMIGLRTPGGGGGYSPQILVDLYVPRQSEKWARAPERAWKCGAPERAWAVLSLKMRGSGTSLIRFERENATPRNCWIERFGDRVHGIITNNFYFCHNKLNLDLQPQFEKY